MTTRRSFVISSALVLCVLLAGPSLRGGDEKNPLVGEWTVVSMVSSGRIFDGGTLKLMSVKIDEKALTITTSFGERPSHEVIEYRRRGPKEIDLVTKVHVPVIEKTKDGSKITIIGKGSMKEIVKPGLYELTGDTLKLCWTDVRYTPTPNPKVERPKTFEAGPGVKTAVFQRKSK